MLTLSRKRVLITEVLKVNDCVGRVTRMISPSLGPDIHLSVDLDEEAGNVRMNSEQFDQVLLNLVLNARDAMPKGGRIVVSTSNVDAIVGKTASGATGTFVRMTVTDSGLGISPEVREHLFEPFFTTKAHGKGTGLGLAMVYGIVKDVGGEIAVRSTEGAGATFEVFMPRVEERISQAVRGKGKPSGVSAAPKTILLVDDQATLWD